METNATLLDKLCELYPDSSKTTLRSWLSMGRISVDGMPTKIGNTPLKGAEKIKLLPAVKPDRAGIEVLYEDSDVVVIEKPSGLLSVATDNDAPNHVHHFLKRRFPAMRVFPVHRLDRDTSGVMVFALNEAARDHLKEQFFHHTILREYQAIVEGKLDGSGTWKSQLIEDSSFHVHVTDKGGKMAVTHYEVIEKRRNTTLLKLKLETGRKNQIRVHSSEAGHPVVGDKKYGAHSSPFGRLCLHASKLAFVHPKTGKLKSFVSRRRLP